MGVLNVTPDSFSDGGRYFGGARAVARAFAMVEEGADLIDIGGESTRPGSAPVAEAEELRRVLPVLEALHAVPIPLSVDTRRPGVMRAALAAGASMVNDVEALGAPGALEAVASSACAVCLMHMQGRPATMQQAPHYADVVGEVKEFLGRRLDACEAAGIARARLVIDPGFGFGKALAHNVVLLQRLGELAALGVPVLAGLSRKSMLGAILGRPAADRTAASLAAALLAAQQGAKILRVHDIRETRDALAVWQALATP
ncbi:MAG: dihydropteroate synthase [Betaproteobacteria bacterium RIFCSPLOWO2_12_FULL_67_28]|nr:MAG: dihydropteroate synthase [Betaproteobacteria bacterium RIFCSPLOWO2_02_FULL_68_150]OGA64687.1 MAG: dihydropteroate synthase [Betaproteobacteria bacterium RIFCSPLOWO2_12_FULL_67_28]